MQSKFLKVVAVIFVFALLTACFPKNENEEEIAPPIIFESIELQNGEIVQPETEIYIEEGTSAEKVEIYTEKAQ